MLPISPVHVVLEQRQSEGMSDILKENKLTLPAIQIGRLYGVKLGICPPDPVNGVVNC